MSNQQLPSTLKQPINPLFIVALVATVHIVVSGILFVNKITTKAIIDEGEAFHTHYYTQFAGGGHCYYPEGHKIASYAGKYPEEGFFNRVTDTYPPLAGTIYGVLIKIFGADIRVIRFFSFLFGFASLYIVALIIWHFSKNGWLSYIGVAIASAINYGWPGELGPNNLLVFFSLLGIYLIIRDDKLSWLSIIASSLAFSCAFLTKQTGLAYIAIQLFFLFIKAPKKAIVALLLHSLLIGTVILYFIARNDADFIYWVFITNAQQNLVLTRIWDWLYLLFIRQWGILMSFMVVGVFWKIARDWRNIFQPEIMFLAASFLAGTVTSLKYGSGLSQCWPFLTLLIAMGLAYAGEFLAEGKISPVICSALLIVQTLTLVEDFRYKLIDKEDEERFEMMLNLLNTPGKQVYWVDRPYYSILAGAHIQFLPADGCWEKGTIHPELYNKKWRAFFEGDPYDVVILDIPQPDGFFPLYQRLSVAYQPAHQLNPHSKYPDTNALRRKKIIFTKKPLQNGNR
jgi:hypothetical protein